VFIRKRKNGFYHIYYNGKDGKRKTISTKKTTQADALKFLTNFQQEIERRSGDEVQTIDLKSFTFQFLRNAEINKAYKTMKVYRTTLNFFQKYFSNINLHTITNADIKKYLEQRLSTSSIFSARKDLINLKAAFRYALEENYIKVNPCNGIKQFTLPQKQPLYFSKQDYEKLLEIIDDREFKNLIMIAANTGLRLMEVLSLNWAQVDLNIKNIILDQRDHITKSKKIRSVPINNNIYPVLLEMQQHSTGDNLFSYSGRNKDVYVSMKFKHYVKKAKLNPLLHFHSLRHSFASWLVQSGVSIYLISKLLGHSNISTTEIYSHLRQDDLLDCVNSLN